MIVDKVRFGEMFKDALLAANRIADAKPEASIDQIELHFRGTHDLSFDEATSELFIDVQQFFRVIDVAVHPKRGGWFFVRPSGHTPDSWEKTMHPTTTGPFNVMVPA